MLWIDYLFLTILVISALFGLTRGLLRELLALTIWVVAFGVSAYGYLALSDHLTFFAEPTVRYVAARLLLIVATLLVGAIINALLSRLLETLGLSLADRLLGLGFGLLRGAIILGVVLFFWEHYFNGTKHPLWYQSPLIPEAYRYLQMILKMVNGTVKLF